MGNRNVIEIDLLIFFGFFGYKDLKGFMSFFCLFVI